jgi:hypothetical protein
LRLLSRNRLSSPGVNGFVGGKNLGVILRDGAEERYTERYRILVLQQHAYTKTGGRKCILVRGRKNRLVTRTSAINKHLPHERCRE